ncbi:hypothetical protein DB30_07460 [Enhygromyxa salina]|uniref:Uncharacterized protein n=1 Tax=Enhygromyxa salina TaxID=215803 RepID=A0A0C2D179_9BACT|nr:hypothetical protein DB30_07460 [Enhygromyxa salina]
MLANIEVGVSTRDDHPSGVAVGTRGAAALGTVAGFALLRPGQPRASPM